MSLLLINCFDMFNDEVEKLYIRKAVSLCYYCCGVRQFRKSETCLRNSFGKGQSKEEKRATKNDRLGISVHELFWTNLFI